MLYTGCICYIKAEFFVASDSYYIQIRSHGISIANTTFLAAQKVKPRAPVNVTIEHNGETAKVHWESGYTMEAYLFQKLNYEVQITSKQDPTEVKRNTLSYLESQYIIRKRLFRKGHDFLMKIRSMPNINSLYAGIWSEWSPEIQWHNDYELSAYDIIGNTMPVIGPAIAICILLCFVCGLICKRKWWNKIPDPSNSHLAMTILHTTQVPESKSDANCSILPLGNNKKKKNICSKRLKKLISQNQDNTDKQPETHKSTPYYNCIDRGAVKNVFIPEIIAVERTLSLTSLVVDINLENEPKISKENDEEVQPLECDFINRMFFEILNTDSKQDKVMDLSDNLGNENMNGSLLLEDICYEDGKHIGLLYNYTRVNSQPETQSKDFNNGQEFRFWKDSPPYVLTLNSNGSCSENDCISSAVWQYKTGFDDDYKPMVSDSPQSHCLKTVNCTNHNLMQKSEACMTISDTLCNKLQIILEPNSDCLVPNLNEAMASSLEVCRADMYMECEYKQFDEVVHQDKNLGSNNLRLAQCPVLETGYKPFKSFD
ncbi:interleukin-4 receptor subunit alpha isoform X2 [Lithobates pipiens]